MLLAHLEFNRHVPKSDGSTGRCLATLNVKSQRFIILPEARLHGTWKVPGPFLKAGIQWCPVRMWQKWIKVISSSLNPAAAAFCYLNMVTWKRRQIRGRLVRITAVWTWGDKSLYSSSSSSSSMTCRHISDAQICLQRTPCAACWRRWPARRTLPCSTWRESRPWPNSLLRSFILHSALMN